MIMDILTEQVRAAFEASANCQTRQLTKAKDGSYVSNTTHQALEAFTEGARWMAGLVEEPRKVVS
jgi:hypothetical protein